MRNLFSVMLAGALLAAVIMFSARSNKSRVSPDGKATIIERTYWDGRVAVDTIPMGPLTADTDASRLRGLYDPLALAAVSATSLCAIGCYVAWVAWKSG